MTSLTGSSSRGPLKQIEFCLNCEDPGLEGSRVGGLAPKHGLQEFKVKGELVITVPNDCSDRLLNHRDLKGAIALVERGGVPLKEKILLVQEAGAAGVLIADDGQCAEDFMRCGKTGGVQEGGFAHRDGEWEWIKVSIPAVLISQSQGLRLKEMMDLREVKVAGHGRQLVPRT
ncbi:unnamed protein product [Chrysoparadoxa australica]